MATKAQLKQLTLHWGAVVQEYCQTVHSQRLDFIPKGSDESIKSLLTNWEHAEPNTVPEPTEAQLLTALATVTTQQTAEKTVKTTIRNAANNAVGLTVTALKADQNAKDALLAILLAQAGAIAADGTIRPLAEWVNFGE